jgi:hypothetical protein
MTLIHAAIGLTIFLLIFFFVGGYFLVGDRLYGSEWRKAFAFYSFGIIFMMTTILVLSAYQVVNGSQ